MCAPKAPKIPDPVAPPPPLPAEALRPTKLLISKQAARGRTGKPGGIRGSLLIPAAGLNPPQG